MLTCIFGKVLTSVNLCFGGVADELIEVLLDIIGMLTV